MLMARCEFEEGGTVYTDCQITDVYVEGYDRKTILLNSQTPGRDCVFVRKMRAFNEDAANTYSKDLRNKIRSDDTFYI